MRRIDLTRDDGICYRVSVVGKDRRATKRIGWRGFHEERAKVIEASGESARRHVIAHDDIDDELFAAELQ